MMYILSLPGEMIRLDNEAPSINMMSLWQTSMMTKISQVD